MGSSVVFVLYSGLLLLISALEIAGCTLPNLLISPCGSFGTLLFLFCRLTLNELPTDDAFGLDDSLKNRIEKNNIQNAITAPHFLYCGSLSE